jgi:site-specific DNA recombinase
MHAQVDDFIPNLPSLSSWYRDKLSQDIKRGLRLKAADGFLVGPPKLGYTIKRTRLGSLAIPDPAMAPAIAEAFLAVASGMSLRDVLGRLDRLGVKTRKGNPLPRLALVHILHDPYYAGIVIQEGRKVTGRHEPLVSLHLFDTVQAELASR